MLKFAIGLVVGLLIGGSVTATAAGIFGSGTLTGWTVTKDGEEVCTDPTISGREIECD